MDYVPPQAHYAQYQENAPQRCPFIFREDVAQYGGSDYANAVRVERGITIDEAMKIAMQDPNIDYFFYTKAHCMVLIAPPDLLSDPLQLVTTQRVRFDSGKIGVENCRIFHKGDAVFFKADGLWTGEAKGYADMYFKTMHAAIESFPSS